MVLFFSPWPNSEDTGESQNNNKVWASLEGTSWSPPERAARDVRETEAIGDPAWPSPGENPQARELKAEAGVGH